MGARARAHCSLQLARAAAVAARAARAIPNSAAVAAVNNKA